MLKPTSLPSEPALTVHHTPFAAHLRGALRAGFLSVSLACLAFSAAAEKPEKLEKHGKGHSQGHKERDSREVRGERDTGGERDGRYAERGSNNTSSVQVNIQLGGFFGEPQRMAVREYYEPQIRAGKCPPGLAKKGNGCQPPGQAKKWRMGQPLPGTVTVYPVPRAVTLQIGLPPAGYKYVRVASDILLIAIGTGMVIDAIEDLSGL